MKLINDKEELLKKLDIVLTISELDSLINFLTYTKKEFLKRKKKKCIEKIHLKNEEVCIEKIKSFKELVSLKSTEIEDHVHYVDWYEKIYNESTSTDLCIHTNFYAKSKKDDSFVWINEELD